MMSSTDYLALFQDRHRQFDELIELSRRQAALVETDDYPRLLALLGTKQRVLGRLEELGRQHPRLWQNWRVDRDGLAPAIRRQCEDVLARSEDVLAEMLEHERASTSVLEARRVATREQLQAVAAGVNVNDAYRDSLAPVTHRHLDEGS
jgi:hypothetical protein